MSSTLEGLVEMLSDDNEGTRWKAAESLGRMGDTRAVEPLIDTLWDDDARVRLKAVWALGMLGDPRALGSPCRNSTGSSGRMRGRPSRKRWR